MTALGGMSLMVTIFVIVLVGLVLFLWLFERCVRAGYGKWLLWFLWLCFGVWPALFFPASLRLVAQAWVWLYAILIFALPLWWGVRWAQRREMGQR